MCDNIVLMDNVLIATWFVLFGGGVAIQTLTPIAYPHKVANQTGALMSLIFLIVSIPVALEALAPKYAIIVATSTLYLMVNAWILLEWRFHPLRTAKQTLQNSQRLLALLLVTLLIDFSGLLTNSIIAICSLLLAIAVLGKLHFIISRARQLETPELNMRKSPTVSLAIPARNETHALTQQLKSSTKSDYKKLEILVIDDCSQDNTAQIIRSFAADGVRFIKGRAPSESWIGKNFAYKVLEEESSGDIILFSGVDTRYEPETVTKLVSYMEHRKLDMISIMPRHDRIRAWSMLVQPVRYLMMVVRATKKHPPILSTVWAIRRDALERHGGFAAVENSIVPEAYFARQLGKKASYRFMIASPSLGLSTFKKPSSQRETAIRYIYPSLGKSLANHALLSIFLAVLFIYPLLFVLVSLFSDWSATSTLFSFTLLVFYFAYLLVMTSTYPRNRLLTTPIYFVLGLFSMYWLSIRSMIDYELDRIIWKGRNVCVPVMMSSIRKSD